MRPFGAVAARALVNELAAETTSPAVIHHGTCDLSPRSHRLLSLCPSSSSTTEEDTRSPAAPSISKPNKSARLFFSSYVSFAAK